MRKHGRRYKVYVGFMDLEKAYDMLYREALCQVLRMYDASVQILNGINAMLINRLAYAKIKGAKSECFGR